MSELFDCHPDDLIAEVQRQLSLGRFGYEGLYSANQLNFRAMWHGLAGTIHDASLVAFDHPQVAAIRARFHELAGASGLFNPTVFAINTTLHGVADPGAHQAKWREVAAR